MSCDVATWADTSSNQAIKDPGQRRCGSSNLGKFINLWLRRLWLRAACRKIPLRDIPPTKARSGSQQPSLPALHYWLITSTVSFQFQLIASGFSLCAFHSNFFVLYLKQRTASIPSAGNPLLQADEFKADLNDDRVRKGCRSAESTVSARWAAMT